MRYLGVLMLVTLFFSQGIQAQEIEITPMLGYTVRNDLKFVEGTMDVTDVLNIGANFSFPTSNRNSRFEITLSNSFAQAKWNESPDYADLIPETDYKMNVTYFQLAWVVQGYIQKNFNVFFGPNLGLVNYNLSKSGVGNVPRFSIGAQTGINYYFDRVLGIKVQALMALPVFMGEGKHFRNIIEDTGAGVNDYITVSETTFPVNLVMSAGLIFRIRTR